MQRICGLGLCLLFALVIGCGKETPRQIVHVEEKDKDKDKIKVIDNPDAKDKDKDKDKGKDPEKLPEVVDVLDPKVGEGDPRETALLEAVDLLAEKKYPEAIAALRKAQAASKYSEAIEREIFRVRAAMERQEAAGKAVEDVKTVLREGKADEAADLAGKALEQFGGGDQAPELARLKQEADAVVNVNAPDADARFAALKTEGDGHFEKKTLRSAIAAYEQALAVKQDQPLADRLVGVRETVATYDDNRARADELRRDPTRIEEALSYLHKAQGAWDTLEVRQQIDEFSLILERRRDRVAIAHFDVRGNVAAVSGGFTPSEVQDEIAEKLLPHFRPRFDVVEREQLGRVLRELRLESDDLADNAAARRELARASRVRYLVIGSVTTLGGLTVSARLVEASTGLIVQTASVSANDLESVVPKLKQLALVLQLDDAQKMEFEAKLASANNVPVKAIEATPVVVFAPPPELPKVAPRVIITFTRAPLQPQQVGVVTFRHFNDLPPVVLVPPAPKFFVIEGDRRHRLLRLCLELGDNFFLCHRFHDAERYYALALNLAGPRREVLVRVENCRRFLPPPPTTVRPRVAVFGFVSGKDSLAQNPLGDWAADTITPYLGANYDVVGRGKVAWYLGRLGLTMLDLLTDPSARVALARAMNVRYFVFGTINTTTNYEVATHFLDAESGVRTGFGVIHVQDQFELKLRINELVVQMGVKPDEQLLLVKLAIETQKALIESHAALKANDPNRAADVSRAALKTAPGNVALAAVLAEAERRQRLAFFEAVRQKEAADREKAINDAAKRNQALILLAVAAREKALRDAAVRTDETRKQQEKQRELAAVSLRFQAKAASGKGDHARAVLLLQSAVTMKANEELFRELGAERAAADKANLNAIAAEKKKRDDALTAQREAALRRITAEREIRVKAEAERHKAQEVHDLAAYNALMTQGKAMFEAKKYAEAQAAALSARNFRDTPESLDLVPRARYEIALEKADAAEKSRLEDERKKVANADALRKKKQEDYALALAEGRKMVEAKKYDDAAKHYATAKSLFDTDAAKTGLKTTELLRKQEQDAIAAQKAAAAAEKEKDQKLKTFLTQGRAALEAKQYVKAMGLFKQAKKLSPGDVEALAGLSRAKHEIGEDRQREEDYKLAMSAGADAMKKKNFQGAVNSYRQALVKKPGDAAATAALADAQKQVPVVDQKEVMYQAAMKLGQTAEAAKKWADAVKHYDAALVQKPADPAATAARKNAMTEAAKLDTANKKEADYQAAMKLGQTAEAAKKWADAVKHYDAALVQKPSDPAATAARKNAMTEAAKLDTANKKEADYQAAMKLGQTAEAAKKWADAVKHYDAALVQKPGDPAATAARRNAVTEAAKLDTANKKEADYQAAMKQGKALFDNKKYAEAVKAYDAALVQKPGDVAAQNARKAAVDAQPKIDPKDKQREEDYKLAMSAGQAAMKQGKYQGAVNSYTEALRLKKDDPAAKAGLGEAQRLLNAELDRQKEANYQALMKQAKAAMDGKKYADAIKSYDDALKLKPGDAEAIKGKRAATDAQPQPKADAKAEFAKAMQSGATLEKDSKNADAVKAFTAAVKWGTELNDRPGLIRAYMGVGRNEHAQKRFPEAVKAYEEVIKRDPANVDAKAALTKAKANKQ